MWVFKIIWNLGRKLKVNDLNLHLLSKQEKKFGQSLKPNDKQNIYKFPVGSLTLKKCTVCLV